nr:hypothetical protein GCM10020185_37790 [Pseudomonas brassicacearum subsp. brassicacearum]
MHQRGRTRTRDTNHTAAPNDTQPLDDAQTPSRTPDSFMSEMETRQKQLMEKQFQLQMGMEERQSAMLLVKKLRRHGQADERYGDGGHQGLHGQRKESHAGGWRGDEASIKR